MATSRSDTYEKTTHITAVITFVVLMWLFSFAVTYSLDRQFAKYFVIAFTFVPVYTVSIGVGPFDFYFYFALFLSLGQ
ncbi:hypothetical protein Q1695_013597 [Nippostrongylus brasiliensis]|nr:hypothetical protein Q1695_013597 [Nippostrongylus brasiliensis]